MSARWIRWTRRCVYSLVTVSLIVLTIVAALVQTGFVQRWARKKLIRELEARTGTRVELGGFHLQLWKLRCELDDLTMHGLETPDVAPLLHVRRIRAAIRVTSFLHQKFALDELYIEEPELAVRVDSRGHTNIPQPRVKPGKKPWNETLFDLHVGRFELTGGSAWFNDRKIPLAVLGDQLDFSLSSATGEGGVPEYTGSLDWRQVAVALHQDSPVSMGLSAKFTLYPSAFTLEELTCRLPGTELDLHAELPDFAQPDWNLRYRGRLGLSDIRQFYHQPKVPDGNVAFSGKAAFHGGKWAASGHYDARGIGVHDRWFHATDMRTWGDYEFANDHGAIPNLEILALGGRIGGRLDVDTRTLAFRTQTSLRGVSLQAALAAVDNPGFPVNTMHWDAVMNVDSVNTWTANFHDFRTRGTSQWTPPAQKTPGTIPVSAQITFDYYAVRRNIILTQSVIDTPTTSLNFDGLLGGQDSALELKLSASDLQDWDDFINDIRGPEATPSHIAGKVAWKGRILGPIAGPTFVGRLQAQDASFDRLSWNEIDGTFEYSPDFFSLTDTTIRWKETSADLNLRLDFDHNWGFSPTSPWTLDVTTKNARVDDLQEMVGTNYPVSGLLSGDFRGSGTHEDPALDAQFEAAQLAYRGSRLDKVAGTLHLSHDEWSLKNAELTQGDAHANGEIEYAPEERQVKFEISGKGVALQNFRALQNPSFPFAGVLDFNLHGQGPLLAPAAEGDFHVANLTIGADVQGDFHGHLASDGQTARVTLDSDMNSGKMDAEVTVHLQGNLPVQGHLSARDINMDAAIMAGLHLKQVSGHSSVTGEFSMTGEILKPETIEITAAISNISFIYELVNIQNDGPVTIVYRKNEVRIERAHLHGPNTDVDVSGSARFDGDRPLHFTLSGGLNLRFVKGFLPDMNAQGAMKVNISIEGTVSRPRITGTANVQDASANYADFPVGLSHVNGVLVFDSSRLLFDHISAQAGGGELTLYGSLVYGEGQLRYEVNAVTPQVRIRYPAGMSWLVGGKLQLAGTSEAAILSGQVEVKRVLLGGNLDVTSFFQNASLSAPTASASPFLRNLTFDVSGHTSPGARIEWAGAHVEIDGDVRMRGNWDRPIILGHIHLLGGEMSFRGNTYELTRGDINFANPFQIDPELNIEATTTISQYQVTINFSGRASRLSLSYRSDPPLPDTDIIALLAIGSTGEESAYRSQTSGSQNYGATALLSEAISSGLGGRIEKLFGITHFRVDPFLAGTATESNAAARVTIQQQVTHDMTVTYSSNTSSSQYQLIQVEYSIRRDLSVVFLRDINGTYGFDIKFVRHFN